MTVEQAKEAARLAGTRRQRMTRLEKVLSMNTGYSEMEIISCLCPHDFGIKDEAKSYKRGWGCKALSGCEGCWNKEVEEDKNE